MKKIPTIFKRNFDTHQLTDEINSECLWVFSGEGVATRKYDGTCCLVKDGELFKRREIKKGKIIPDEFIQEDADEITLKVLGWMPVTKEDKWHVEALKPHLKLHGGIPIPLVDGTYELVGPKIQGNPEKYERHTLLPHDSATEYAPIPTELAPLKEWLEPMDIEGIVWHHTDGRMAKIKKKDFGLRRFQ